MQFINKYVCLALTSLALVSCQGEQKLEYFDNHAYIPGTSMVAETVIKGNMGIVSKSFNVSLARPAEEDIRVSYKIDLTKLATYNKAYYAQAELLPLENYNIPEQSVATIEKGTTSSTPISIEFKSLEQLDRSKQYVLPVSVQTDKVCLLKSASVYYYVFKAGALINVVADIEDNHLEVDWKNQQPLSNMNQLTMEALIRVRKFDYIISTVMGIEGYFLMRIGDASFPNNQIQIAMSGGNVPDADPKKGLPTGKWVHVALTYDDDKRELIIYVDGKQQSKSSVSKGPITLASRSFQVGRSWEDKRDLNGEIAEARIWNTVRTQQELARDMYFVNPNSEGLVAYWKFDDENPTRIKDHTTYGNDLVAKRGNLKWTAVSLPATK